MKTDTAEGFCRAPGGFRESAGGKADACGRGSRPALGRWLLASALAWGCAKKEENFGTAPTGEAYCGADTTGAWKDTVKVATLNMTVGFGVAGLLFVNPEDKEAVYSLLRTIREEYTLNRPSDRVALMAGAIARESPEVVGLQEVMTMAWNDTLDSDFLPQLVKAIADSGGAEYDFHFAPLNDTTFDATASEGSLKVRFREGNAVLYKREFAALDTATHVFQNIFNQFGTASVRGMNYVLLDNGKIKMQIFNTHLEVPILGTYRVDQGAEMRTHMASLCREDAAQIAIGDFNTVPDQDVYNQLLEDGWMDSFRLVNPADLSGTCCVAGSRMYDPQARFSGRRLDYVFYRGKGKPLASRMMLDERLPTQAGDSIYAADHKLVLSTLAVE